MSDHLFLTLKLLPDALFQTLSNPNPLAMPKTMARLGTIEIRL